MYKRFCAYVMLLSAPWSGVALLESLYPAQGVQESNQKTAADIGERLRVARRARDWKSLLRTWDEYGGALAAPGPWKEACALALEARYETWDVPALERELTAAAARMDVFRGAQPDGPRALDALFAGLDLDVRVLRSRVLQSRHRHEDAVNLLGPLFDQERAVGDLPQSSYAYRVALDLGRSLLALKRVEDGYAVLSELVAHNPATREAVLAQALLQRAPNGLPNYWGKYRGDPAHRVRMETLRATIPAACRRLARVTDWKPTDLNSFPIGVADLPPGLGPLSGLTTADPRIHDFEPIIVVFSEALANDFEDPELILAHELVHARLLATLGLNYDAWPMWAAEGLPIALSGQADDILFETLGFHLEENPEAFLGEHPETLLRPRFQVDPFEPSTMHIDSSGLAFWELAHEPGGLRPLVRALDEGALLADAIEAVTKLKLPEFVRHAEVTVLEAMLAERARALDVLRELERARKSGWADAARVSQAVLDAGCGRLARGYAMFLRARALAEVGPLDGAIAANRALIEARREHKRLLLPARLGLGSCLARAGRFAEARTTLAGVVRDEMGGNYAELALGMLQRLPVEKD